MDNEDIRLTKYSHGAGCGCKISPAILAQILSGNTVMPDNTRLIVGNHSNDDAAVYDLGNGTALISTTDFFMPIVDDPYEFGRIAAANAISDVYAMGGKPILAIAILGWPVNILPASVAQRVIAGARSICSEAGIPLAGGHSIDSPEPIFGLSVNGLIETPFIKRNDAARIGDLLFLTKKIGVGILTTAEKKGVIQPEHSRLAAEQMMQLNSLGEVLGKIPAVHAMTDVTGFGLLGHLCEMADGSGLSSELIFQLVPLLTPHLHQYIDSGCIPGGMGRNWNSYGEKIAFGEDVDIGIAKAVLCDPQTSGGLLVAVSPEGANEVTALLRSNNLCHIQIGVMTEKRKFAVLVRNEPG